MSRFLPRHGALTNLNVQATLEPMGPKLFVDITVAADVKTPTGRRRFLSEQRVDLQNFLDACAREAGADQSQEPEKAP